MTYEGPNRRNGDPGRREDDKRRCHFYDTDSMRCSEVDGVKRNLKWGVGIIITVFIAAFSYFAHDQSKTHALMIQQTKAVSDLKGLVEYRVLPKLREREKDGSESGVDRFRDLRLESSESWNHPTGGISGDRRSGR